jgi:hypothetical protein
MLSFAFKFVPAGEWGHFILCGVEGTVKIERIETPNIEQGILNDEVGKPSYFCHP